MLDEKALRREGFFEEGTPVRLADGQEWQFPKPRVRLVPANNDQGWKTTLTMPDGGVFAKLTEEYRALPNDPTVGQIAAKELALAKHLLTLNYDLTDEQVGSLIQFSYDLKSDPEGYEIRDAVIGAVFGYGSPKQSAAGDDSPSSSTASTLTGGPSTT